jgi:hypothetical protein
MQKSAKVQAVYNELRLATGGEVPAGALIRLAKLIVQSYLEENIPDEFGLPRESVAFASLAVDTAMKDGGWRVCEFELDRARDIDKMPPAGAARLDRLLTKWLGPEWRHRILRDSI